jgi:TonB family protein
VLVSFIIDEEGNVSQAEILDSFNVKLNDVVLDKVRQTKYKPAVQNGRAVRVKYQLPIVFK